MSVSALVSVSSVVSSTSLLWLRAGIGRMFVVLSILVRKWKKLLFTVVSRVGTERLMLGSLRQLRVTLRDVSSVRKLWPVGRTELLSLTTRWIANVVGRLVVALVVSACGSLVMKVVGLLF